MQRHQQPGAHSHGLGLQSQLSVEAGLPALIIVSKREQCQDRKTIAPPLAARKRSCLLLFLVGAMQLLFCHYLLNLFSILSKRQRLLILKTDPGNGVLDMGILVFPVQLTSYHASYFKRPGIYPSTLNNPSSHYIYSPVHL